MKIIQCISICAFTVAAFLAQTAFSASPTVVDTSDSPHARLRGAGLDEVRWTEGFWADRFQTVRDVTLACLYKAAADPEHGHAVANFRIAAGLEDGEFVGTNWQDAWVHKWIEAAAAVYEITRDPELDARMDELIAIIAKARQADGYIATQNIVRGRPRFQDPRHHELYVMGHLITAACLHHRVTGKDTFLDVARKTADYLAGELKGKNPKFAHFPFNPSLVMAAVELYRTTGERRYLELAQTVVDMRGAFRGGSDLNQDRIPLRRETEVVGHAVFYSYLYSGAADIYMETGEKALLEALERLWRDFTQRKMYVTGGSCPLHRGFSIRDGKVWSADDVHEAAGAPYDLPNSTAYNETCGQVGVFMWNWRMLLIQPEARYADLMEREMYNGFLPSLSQSGERFFYTNPLRWYGEEQVLLSNDSQLRHEIGRAKQICCPTNVLRALAEMHGYFYAFGDEGLWIHHYGGSVLENEAWKVEQKTNYPWEGTIRIDIERAPAGKAIYLRIPAWAEGGSIQVNGNPLDKPIEPGTYVALRRPWKTGDSIILELPLEPRLVQSHHKVEDTRNQVAVQRGPIVYCLESPDLPDDTRIWDVVIPSHIELQPAPMNDLPGNLLALEGKALRKPRPESDPAALYRDIAGTGLDPIGIRLIPYYAWANRGVSEMTVWLPILWQTAP